MINQDTICAVSTAPEPEVAVIRVSGSVPIAICDTIVPKTEGKTFRHKKRIYFALR